MRHFVFNGGVTPVFVSEVRAPSVASEVDGIHMGLCGANGVRVVDFLMKYPAVAVGKQQSIKYVREGLPVIRKVTNGTAVIFMGTELSLSISVGVNTLKDVKTTTGVRKWFTQQMANTLYSLYGISCDVVDIGSRHPYKPAGCFNALTKGEIAYKGRKLLGVSFTRYGKVIFGHMMLYMDPKYHHLYEYVDRVDGEVDPIAIREIVPEACRKVILQEFQERIMMYE